MIHIYSTIYIFFFSSEFLAEDRNINFKTFDIYIYSLSINFDIYIYIYIYIYSLSLFFAICTRGKFSGNFCLHILAKYPFVRKGLLNLLERPPFIKSIHSKQVVVESHKAFKWPATSKTIIKIPSVIWKFIFLFLRLNTIKSQMRIAKTMSIGKKSMGGLDCTFTGTCLIYYYASHWCL